MKCAFVFLSTKQRSTVCAGEHNILIVVVCVCVCVRKKFLFSTTTTTYHIEGRGMSLFRHTYTHPPHSLQRAGKFFISPFDF
jgi:hypothetical protein